VNTYLIQLQGMLSDVLDPKVATLRNISFEGSGINFFHLETISDYFEEEAYSELTFDQIQISSNLFGNQAKLIELN